MNELQENFTNPGEEFVVEEMEVRRSEIGDGRKEG